MAHLYIQIYEPLYVKAGDVWITPSTASTVGEIKQFTSTKGWDNLIISNLYQSLVSRGYQGSEEDLLQALVSEAEKTDTAANISTTSGQSVQEVLDSLESTLEDLNQVVEENVNNIEILQTTTEEQGDKIDSLDKEVATKQDTLESGTNIKTINAASILGSGDIEIPVMNPQVAPSALATEAQLADVITAFNNLITLLTTSKILKTA